MPTTVVTDADVQEEWEQFWAPIVAPNGVLDIEQVKKELSDFSMVMDIASEVYCEITGGRISKPNTTAAAILGEYRRCVDEMIAEALAERVVD